MVMRWELPIMQPQDQRTAPPLGFTEADARLIDDHLAWIRYLIGRHQLAQRHDHLTTWLQYIQQRRHDPRLYLAVIGEFNSGKSTLINALIGADLLRAGIEPTTAAATSLCYGATVDLIVTLHGSETYALSREVGQLASRLRHMNPNLTLTPDDVPGIIAALTADNVIAPSVTACYIYHPGAFLRDGAVIIDTPGVNNEHAEHARVTEDVLARAADVAIIAVPAMWQISLTFADFLRERIGPMIHRCLFVVTKMDEIDDDERERVYSTIRQALEALGLHEPTIYPVAARPVLKAARGGTLTPEQQYWRDDFSRFTAMIAQRLRRERTITIFERLVRLLVQALADLDALLEERSRAFTAQAERVNRDTIADLDAFSRQEHQTTDSTLNATHQQVRAAFLEAYQREQEASEHEVEAAIKGAATTEALKAVVEGKISDLLTRHANMVSAQLQTGLMDIERAASAARLDFAHRFQDAYQRLQSLVAGPATRPLAPIASTHGVETQNISTSAKTLFGKLASAEGNATGGGAVAGAVVGTMIAPVIGTAIGFLLGGLVGSMFGPSLDERKRQIWNVVKSEIGKSFEQARGAGLAQIDGHLQQRRHELYTMIGDFAAQYRTVYEQLRTQQRQAQQALATETATIQRDRAEITQRRSGLEAHLALLRGAVPTRIS